MRILQIVNSLECGGLEKFAIDLSVGLKRIGHESIIAGLQEKGELIEVAKKHNIRTFGFTKKKGLDWNLIGKLKKLIREEKIDIIHTHNLAPLIYGTIAGCLAGNARLVHTRHGREPDKAAWFIWAMNKAVVPISNDAKECLLKCNHINPKKVNVIYNGIDIDSFNQTLSDDGKRKLRTELGLKDNSIVIGNVGRLAKEKDQASLIKAMRHIAKREEDVQCIIVGDGPLKGDLRKLIDQYNLSDKVKLLGYRNDISRLLNIIDVYVLSSFTEGISLTLLEAMAARKPVVATKVGGNPEVVVDGVTGFIVPCGFPERIQNALMKLHVNRALIKTMGDAGRKRVEEVFNLTPMVASYESVYKGLLKS